MKAGKSVIIPPKYGLWGTVGVYAFWVGVIIILFVLQTQFLDYLSFLEKDCEMYMGLNPTYFRELVSLIIWIITFMVLVCYSIYRYVKVKSVKGEFYPLPKTQPEFIRKVCRMVDKQRLQEERGDYGFQHLVYLRTVCLFVFPTRHATFSFF